MLGCNQRRSLEPTTPCALLIPNEGRFPITISVRSQPEHNLDKKQAGMYNLNDMPGLVQERGLCAPLASQGSTLSSKDADRAKPNQSGIHPDQLHTSAQTVSDLFETIETWDEKETKRVGRSLRRHVEKVIRLAKDTPFEQEVKKRLGKLLASEGAFAETMAQTSRSHAYTVAEHLPLWRTHQIALTMGFEVVNDTFGTLMQQDPYYQRTTILKERLFIHLFASELHQPDKQEITFWTKQGGTIVYRKRSKPIHNRQSFRKG
jgi:hypothetical protein